MNDQNETAAEAPVSHGNLANRVVSRIQQHTHRRIQQLQATVEADRIAIQGIAPSYHVMQLAIVAGLSALSETPWRLESRLELAAEPPAMSMETPDVRCA